MDGFFARCGDDWTFAADADAALDWLFPGTTSALDLAARTAEAAQTAERFEYERIRRCNTAHRMSAAQHELYVAEKRSDFGGALPARWLGLPTLYLTAAQLDGRALPLGAVELVPPFPGRCLSLLESAGVIERWGR